VVKENDTTPWWKHGVSRAVEVVATGLEVTRSAPVRFRSAAEWGQAAAGAGFTVQRCGHLPAREGFFVPHALLVGRRA
jgi:hypothetical protein